MERWSGKTAVVTGASMGIGAEIAVKLANAGLVVVAAARSVDKLQALQKKVTGSGRILPVKCDVGVDIDVINLMNVAKKNGGIDVLVNNAANLPVGYIIDKDKDADFMKSLQQCYSINVFGVLLCTRLAVTDMISRGCVGHVITINSLAGHKVSSLGAASMISVYGSSKYAITQLVESLRLEMAYTGAPIRVTSISPGAVETQMLAHATEKLPDSKKNQMPKLQPVDIADAVLYALSTPDRVNVSELTIQVVGEIF